jgi:putative resolvase
MDAQLLVFYRRGCGRGQTGDPEMQLDQFHAWAHNERADKDILVLSDIESGLCATRRHVQCLLML